MRILKTLGTATDNENFCRATFFLLQPHADPNGITQRWTNWIEHPITGKFAVEIHEGAFYPVRADVNPDLFSGYLQKYVEAGILSDGCIANARNYLVAAAGGQLDIGYAIAQTFIDNGGADQILTFEQATEQGWFPNDEL